MSAKNTKNAAGIYKLINKRTGESYIGQSKNIDERCKRHFNELEKGMHNNSDLQEDFNKGDKFSIEILEEIDISDSKRLRQELESKEVYWIHKERTYLAGYNKTPGGEYDKLLGDIDHSGGRLGGQYSSKVLDQESWDLTNKSKLDRYYGVSNDEKCYLGDSYDDFNENLNEEDNIKSDKEILLDKLHQITGDEILNESFLDKLKDFDLDVFSARRIVDSMENFIEYNDLDVNIDLNECIMKCIEKEFVNQ